MVVNERAFDKALGGRGGTHEAGRGGQGRVLGQRIASLPKLAHGLRQGVGFGPRPFVVMDERAFGKARQAGVFLDDDRAGVRVWLVFASAACLRFGWLPFGQLQAQKDAAGLEEVFEQHVSGAGAELACRAALQAADDQVCTLAREQGFAVAALPLALRRGAHAFLREGRAVQQQAALAVAVGQVGGAACSQLVCVEVVGVAAAVVNDEVFACAQVVGVVASAFVFHVVISCAAHVEIVARAAAQPAALAARQQAVVAFSSVEQVTALASHEGVVSSSAVEAVVAFVSIQKIVAASAHEQVVACASMQPVMAAQAACFAGRGLVVAAENVVAVSAVQGVVASHAKEPVMACAAVKFVIAVVLRRQVFRVGVAYEQVVARAAPDLVAAAIAPYFVVAFACINEVVTMQLVISERRVKGQCVDGVAVALAVVAARRLQPHALPGVAVDDVVALASQQRVAAAQARQAVVAFAAVDGVAAAPAPDAVVACASIYKVAVAFTFGCVGKAPFRVFDVGALDARDAAVWRGFGAPAIFVGAPGWYDVVGA